MVPRRRPDPAQPRKLVRDRARDAILQAILDGTFQPGEALDDSRLQEWLQLSRTPIRQALYALSIEGLIDMAPQAHTRVVQPRREDAISYLQTTGVLIVGITELAVDTATPEQRTEVMTVLQQLIDAAEGRSHAEFIAGMRRYFDVVNGINPNPILHQLSGQAMVALGYHVSVAVPESDIPWEDVALQHQLLLSAWRAGDAEAILHATRRTFGLRGVRWANSWVSGDDPAQGELLV